MSKITIKELQAQVLDLNTQLEGARLALQEEGQGFRAVIEKLRAELKEETERHLLTIKCHTRMMEEKDQKIKNLEVSVENVNKVHNMVHQQDEEIRVAIATMPTWAADLVSYGFNKAAIDWLLANRRCEVRQHERYWRVDFGDMNGRIAKRMKELEIRSWLCQENGQTEVRWEK